MLRFKIRRAVPPGGRFFYEVPETKLFLESLGPLDALVQLVQKHYEVNNIPVPENLRVLVEDFICRNVMDGFCEGEESGKSPKGIYRNLTFWQIVENTRKNLGHTAWIDQAEAERRADICLRCPHNLRHMCTSCNGLRQTVRGLTGGRSTRMDDYIGVCGISGMVIAGLAYMAHPKVHVEVPKPEQCWIEGEGGDSHGK